MLFLSTTSDRIQSQICILALEFFETVDKGVIRALVSAHADSHIVVLVFVFVC
jgi:hypothetical protein